jgi:2,3-bisphosphoglycerate-dependent phosphoglycerate mutase
MNYLILLRHGQSQWNLENRFTGWVDVDLSPKGEEEARHAGELLKKLNVPVDYLFTSVLKRAIRTAEIACQIANIQVPMEKDQALNERHYGDLQGLNKAETASKFGEEQVHIWRRSYDVAPPNGESLKDTAERVWPYYDARIEPLLREGKNVLVVAHGNSLRALVMKLDTLTPEEIVKVEIPTGIPLVYEFENGKPTKKYYLE